MNNETLEKGCEELRRVWKESCEALEDLLTQEQADIALKWAHQILQEFKDAFEEVTDSLDTDYLIALKVIESRCAWGKYNAKANYAAAYKGVVDGEAMLRGSLMSQVIATFEEELGEERMTKVDEFLAESVHDLLSVNCMDTADDSSECPLSSAMAGASESHS